MCPSTQVKEENVQKSLLSFYYLDLWDQIPLNYPIVHVSIVMRLNTVLYAFIMYSFRKLFNYSSHGTSRVKLYVWILYLTFISFMFIFCGIHHEENSANPG